MNNDELQLRLANAIKDVSNEALFICEQFSSSINNINLLKDLLYEKNTEILYNLMIDSFEMVPQKISSTDRKNIVIGMHYNEHFKNSDKFDLNNQEVLDKLLYERINSFNYSCENIDDNLQNNVYACFGIGLSLLKKKNSKGMRL